MMDDVHKSFTVSLTTVTLVKVGIIFGGYIYKDVSVYPPTI